MTLPTIIELAVAGLLIVLGIWLQVRGKREDSKHGSQGAVILIMIGLIMAIHGFGMLEYRKPEVGL
jgi:hypothetical protein